MSVNLTKTLGWSALLHLLVIVMLWFTHQPAPVLVPPLAIEAFVYQPVPATPKPAAAVEPKPAPVVSEQAKPENPIPEPTMTPEPEVVVAKSVKEEPMPAAPPEPLPAEPLPPEQQPADSQTTTTTVVTTAPSSAHTAMSLAERSLAIVTKRQTDISSDTLQAIQQRPELRDRPATTSKTKLSPDHAAANVLMELSDGSFIEKVGDYCYQAKPGANLRADIFSMKPVSCGEDKNAAIYHRIMSKVGQDR